VTRDNQSPDPLGKLAARYDSTVKATLYMIAGVALGLLGATVFLLRDRIARAMLANPDPTPYAWTGGVLAAVGFLLAAVSWFYRGKAFEVRASGVRYTSGRRQTDVAWSDVRRLRVWETRVFMNGRYSRTRWRMLIAGSSDEIRLSETFLSLVSSVPNLIAMIELKSGVKFKHVTEGGYAAEGEGIDEANLSAEELIRRGGEGLPRRRRR